MKRLALLVVGVVAVLGTTLFAVGEDLRGLHASSIPQSTGDGYSALRHARLAGARRLLSERGVPFDPGLLDSVRWRGELRSTLAQAPEMSASLAWDQPLQGVVLADTLHLSESTELVGDAVILVRHLRFGGSRQTIRGPHSIYIFVIDTVSDADGHKVNLTIDTSGMSAVAPPTVDATILPSSEESDVEPSGSHARTAVAVHHPGFPGEDGEAGAEGSAGRDGDPGTDGAPGSCGGDRSGGNGANGENAEPGGRGGDGGNGHDGEDGRNITIDVWDPNGTYWGNARGGNGGNGGAGGQGGTGGKSGKGGKGGDGADCPCDQGGPGNGGNGGNGGNAGQGGDGGNGGNGGNAGNGGSITIWVHVWPANVYIEGDVSAGIAGAGGDAGPAGSPGDQSGSAGAAGSPGSNENCSTLTGTAGTSGQDGNGYSGLIGVPGILGQNGYDGTVGWYQVFWVIEP